MIKTTTKNGIKFIMAGLDLKECNCPQCDAKLSLEDSVENEVSFGIIAYENFDVISFCCKKCKCEYEISRNLSDIEKAVAEFKNKEANF